MKNLIPALKELERRVQYAVEQALGIHYVAARVPDLRSETKLADDVMLATEARDLMATPPEPWVLLPAPRAERIPEMNPFVMTTGSILAQAESFFANAFHRPLAFIPLWSEWIVLNDMVSTRTREDSSHE